MSDISVEFTKGEWVNSGDMEVSIITTIDRSFSHKVEICEVQTGFGGDIGIEQKANAHLIAAAPAMYELLHVLSIDLQIMFGDRTKPIIEDINLLLSSARGDHE